MRLPRRFKKNSKGYVFDRRLLLACLAPLAVLLVSSFVHVLDADYSFYVRCESTACENPFWPDCPRIVEEQAPGLCDQRTLARGVYGSRPGWSHNWLFPAGVGGFIVFFYLNHIKWNGGFET